MKKNVVLLGIVSLLMACENLTTDLPETDTSIYVTGNMVTFPKGTKGIDIYNTVSTIFHDNEYHDIANGEWKYIITEKDNDGFITQTWQSASFTKIKHTHSRHESGVNTHKVYLYFSEANIREFVFEWQRQTTNVWKNDILEGEISFSLLPVP